MSLVNEALKKARLEAARQDAARRGLPLPGLHLAEERRWHAHPAMRAALVAAAVATGALLYLAGRTSAPRPEAAARSAGPEAGAGAVAIGTGGAAAGSGAATAETGASTVGTGTAAGDVEVAAGSPLADRGGGAAIPSGTQDPATSTPTGRAAEATETRSRPRPRLDTEASGAAGTAPAPEPAATPVQTFVRELQLADGQRIHLGGIAWSEDRPYALINGRVVGASEQVHGLTVVAIEQRQVVLEGAAGRFVLRLK